MATPPRLSIVIPSHSQVSLLRACLKSVCEFAPEQTEIIVIDDGSQNSEVSRVAAEFPMVSCWRNSKPQGFCRAVNAGIQLCQGEIVELLNDDTVVTANWAFSALEAFDRHTVDVVAPLVLLMPQSEMSLARIDSAGDEYHAGGYAQKRYHGQRLMDVELRSGFVWGSSATAGFYRRELLLKVGLLPDDFGAYFEDVDLAHRLLKAGGRAWFCSESVVWHHVSASYGRKPNWKTQVRQSCNEERVYWRNQPRQTWPKHAAVLFAKSIKRLWQGNFVPWLCGRIQAWVGGLHQHSGQR